MNETQSKFAEWAVSFSGCDGGTPNARVWLCGIEWGGALDEKYYLTDLPNEISKGSFHPETTYPWAESLKYPYGRSLAKLYAAIQGREVATYRNLDSYDGSEMFKLNLYPIAFHDTSDQLWHRYGLDKLTGFADKRLYQTWCMLHRFRSFSEKLKEYSPDVIIGTGTSYLPEFFLCFGRQMDGNARINVHHLSAGKKNESERGRPLYWARITPKTILVVIPFFSGSSGLNSDALLQEAGDTIRRLSAGATV